MGKLYIFLSLIFLFIKLYCRWRASHSIDWLDHRLDQCVRMKQPIHAVRIILLPVCGVCMIFKHLVLCVLLRLSLGCGLLGVFL